MVAAVKMKVGRELGGDARRVRIARNAIGGCVDLFVDANGASGRKQALQLARFVSPMRCLVVRGARHVGRPRGPAPDSRPRARRHGGGGREYGNDVFFSRRRLAAGAVDVLRADPTCCGGITGFLQGGAFCDAHAVPLSAHTAPSLHVATACALPCVRHVEYFHDHVRIESRFFDGVPPLRRGALEPDLSRPGHGLALKRVDVERYRAP